MLLEIIKVPDKRLEQNCETVSESEFGEELDKKMSDMAETMYAHHGIGLAGPQVGDMRRILVADLGYVGQYHQDTSSYTSGYGSHVVKMVNPQIIEKSEELIKVPEGCLSIPEFTHAVERYKTITVEYFTPFGEKRTETFDDLSAVVVQHECNHLSGTTLLSSVSNFARQRYFKKRNEKAKKG